MKSEQIVEPAFAKVNVALHVLGRRLDGYHELDSIVTFANIGDKLTFTPSDQWQFTLDGPFAHGLPLGDDNIVQNATKRMRELYVFHGVALQPQHVHLTKNLPVASGIGGGSSDAAATMRGLIRVAGTDLPLSDIMKAALQIGADVPVCLNQKSCRMQGIGETITELSKPPALAILLINPSVGLSTRDVFNGLALAHGSNYRESIDPNSPNTWRNDLTEPAISLCAGIQIVLAELNSQLPQSVVRMSGSGATCFALTENISQAEQAATALQLRHPDWWIASSTLR